jgi:hypothetical protein
VSGARHLTPRLAPGSAQSSGSGSLARLPRLLIRSSNRGSYQSAASKTTGVASGRDSSSAAIASGTRDRPHLPPTRRLREPLRRLCAARLVGSAAVGIAAPRPRSPCQPARRGTRCADIHGVELTTGRRRGARRVSVLVASNFGGSFDQRVEGGSCALSGPAEEPANQWRPCRARRVELGLETLLGRGRVVLVPPCETTECRVRLPLPRQAVSRR